MSTTPTSAERAAFESAMNEKRFFPRELDFSMTKSPSGRDEYANTHLESCWVGWQARAAMQAAEPVEKGHLECFLAGARECKISDIQGLRKLYEAPDRAPSNVPQPWQDRMAAHYGQGSVKCHSAEHFMEAELADWRDSK